MHRVSIPFDQSLLNKARDIATAMQKRGHNDHALDTEFVLSSALNIGLDRMHSTWVGVSSAVLGSVPMPADIALDPSQVQTGAGDRDANNMALKPGT